MKMNEFRAKFPAKCIGIAHTEQNVPYGFLDLSIPVCQRFKNWQEREQWKNYGWHSGMCHGKNGDDSVIVFDSVRTVKALWRFGAYSDELIRTLCHTGWYYTLPRDSSEVLRGCTVQIPGKNGVPLYLAGYFESLNDSVVVYYDESFIDQREAAQRADEHARTWAEYCIKFEEKLEAEELAVSESEDE